MFTEVVPTTHIPRSRNQHFTYRVPADLAAQIQPGSLVQIPFARRKLFGVVMRAPFSEEQSSSGAVAVNLSRIKSISGLASQTVLTAQQLNLASWMAEYYHAPLSSVLKLCSPSWMFLPSKKITITSAKQKKQPMSKKPVLPEIALTDEQQHAFEQISQALSPFSARSFLLHGITGSGKTEVYIKAMLQVIAEGRQVLFLVPEIALTSHLISRLSTHIPSEQIAFVHSRVSPRKREQIAHALSAGDLKVIVAPRSGLFLPFQSLGLIVLDEEHDESFKQYDQQPRYHARDVAEQLSRIWNCPVIYGSATPSIELTFAAKAAGAPVLLELSQRYHKIHLDDPDQMPVVEIVDMREEFKKGNKRVISDRLLDEITLTLEQEQQAILFLNRRGMSTCVMCRDCGFVMSCTRCDIPLVYHVASATQVASRLYCHHCGLVVAPPRQCPACRSTAIKFFGAGTQRVEEELHKLFPGIRITRMDADTTRTKDAHQTLLEQFRSGQSDILLGTQMITKGFDLPNVHLVGIISVDSALNMPDFRSFERVFQMVTQVAGRAGRREQRGICILQTYHPDHQVFAAAIEHDYAKFYAQEIQERELLFYPPFSQVVRIVFHDRSDERGQQRATRVMQQLDALSQDPKFDALDLELLGPSHQFIPKRNNEYYWQILVKYKAGNRKQLEPFLSAITDEESIIDIDPVSLL